MVHDGWDGLIGGDIWICQMCERQISAPVPFSQIFTLGFIFFCEFLLSVNELDMI